MNESAGMGVIHSSRFGITSNLILPYESSLNTDGIGHMVSSSNRFLNTVPYHSGIRVDCYLLATTPSDGSCWCCVDVASVIAMHTHIL